MVDVGRGAKIEILAVKWGFPTKPQLEKCFPTTEGTLCLTTHFVPRSTLRPWQRRSRTSHPSAWAPDGCSCPSGIPRPCLGGLRSPAKSDQSFGGLRGKLLKVGKEHIQSSPLLQVTHFSWLDGENPLVGKNTYIQS